MTGAQFPSKSPQHRPRGTPNRAALPQGPPTSTPAAKARAARYRQRRRQRLGTEDDKKRAALASRKSLKRRRHEVNERRRALSARKATKAKKHGVTVDAEAYAQGFRVVTRGQLMRDTTKFSGPRTHQTERTARIADAFLTEMEAYSEPG